MYDTINVNVKVELIGSADYSSGAYEFNTLQVIRWNGELYYAEDSGCSCPIPFDGFAIGDGDASKGYVKATKHEIAARLNERLAEYGTDPWPHTTSEVHTLIARLMR